MQSKSLTLLDSKILTTAWQNGGNVIYTMPVEWMLLIAADDLVDLGYLTATVLDEHATAYDITDAGLDAIGKSKFSNDDSQVETQKAEWVVLGGIVQKAAPKQAKMDPTQTILADAEQGIIIQQTNPNYALAMQLVEQGLLTFEQDTPQPGDIFREAVFTITDAGRQRLEGVVNQAMVNEKSLTPEQLLVLAELRNNPGASLMNARRDTIDQVLIPMGLVENWGNGDYRLTSFGQLVPIEANKSVKENEVKTIKGVNPYWINSNTNNVDQTFGGRYPVLSDEASEIMVDLAMNQGQLSGNPSRYSLYAWDEVISAGFVTQNEPDYNGFFTYTIRPRGQAYLNDMDHNKSTKEKEVKTSKATFGSNNYDPMADEDLPMVLENLGPDDFALIKQMYGHLVSATDAQAYSMNRLINLGLAAIGGTNPQGTFYTLSTMGYNVWAWMQVNGKSVKEKEVKTNKEWMPPPHAGIEFSGQFAQEYIQMLIRIETGQLTNGLPVDYGVLGDMFELGLITGSDRDLSTIRTTPSSDQFAATYKSISDPQPSTMVLGGIIQNVPPTLKAQKTLQQDDYDWLVELYQQGADKGWVPDVEDFSHSFENAGLADAGLIVYDNVDKQIMLTPQGTLEALKRLGQYR